MQKIWEFIKGWFVTIGADSAIEKGGDLIEEALEKFYITHPQTCVAMVSSLYTWIDTAVEDLAAKSKTPLDDDAVDEAKEELEEFASRHGFNLVNLDEGTAND